MCRVLLVRRFLYRRMTCVGMWFGSSRVSSPGLHSYHLTSYPLPCGVSTCFIMALTTYSCGTVVPSCVPFSAILTEFRCCWFSFRCYMRNAYGLLVNCSHISESVRRSMEIVFAIPSSSMLTVCCWTLGISYGPDACCNNLLYRGLTNSSATSDAIAAN